MSLTPKPGLIRVVVAAIGAIACSGVTFAQVSVGYGQVTSAVASHPSAQIVPSAPHQKVIGGGAFVDWKGAGNLLFSAFPSNPSDKANGVPWAYSATWIAASKDHEVADPSTITAFDVVLIDPQEQYIVRQFQQEVPAAEQPRSEAILPAGFVMTGGGCNVEFPNNAPGSLLTGSFPATFTDSTGALRSKWVCIATDHDVTNMAGLGAYVIGVQPANANIRMPKMCISQAVSGVAAHPAVQVGNTCMPNGSGQITGGGAVTSGPGQLLTASFPVYSNVPATLWEARSKDHIHPSPGTVTAFAVVVDFNPPVTIPLRPPGTPLPPPPPPRP
jgi:hypothetical protein